MALSPTGSNEPPPEVAPVSPLTNHEALHEAITDLRAVNAQLERLLCRISGGGVTVDVERDSVTDVSLQHVLECGAGEIKERIAESSQQIESIEDLLF